MKLETNDGIKIRQIVFFVRRYLSVCLVLLCVLQVIAQTREEKLVAAKRMYDEATTLSKQETLESSRAALDKFLEASRLCREVGEKKGEAMSLVFAGIISIKLGDNREALEYFNQALPLFQAVSDKVWQAITLTYTGRSYSELGEKQKALEFFDRSLPVFRAVGNKRGEASTLTNIGKIYSDLGEKEKALEIYSQALLLFRAESDKNGEAQLLNNIGSIYSSLGERQKALESYNQSLALRRALKDKGGEAITLSNIGMVYVALGEKRNALEFFNQSLPLSRFVGDKNGEATTLNNIGGVYNELGERLKALEKYVQSLELYRAMRDKSGQATTLNNIAGVLDDLGEKQKALEYHNRALSLIRAVGDKSDEAQTLNNIGAIYNDLGEKQKALEYLNRSLALRKLVGDKSGEALTLDNLMFVWNALNNPKLAVFYGKQSVNTYQQLRSNIKDLDKSVQQTYLKEIENTYRQLADILVAEGRFAEAQQVLAMLKEEEYFEYVRRDADEIKNLKDRIKLRPDELKLIERYELLIGKVTRIGAEFQKLDDKKRKLPEGAALPAGEQKRYDELSAHLADANAAFRLFLEKELVAELGKAVKKEIDVDRALQEKLREWGEGAIALYTVAGENRYRVILTTPTVQIDGKTEIKAADLNKKIFAFREALQNPSIDPRPLGKELYDILIKPVEKDLLAAGAKTLIWSLDGTLRYIPLAALSPDGKTYLVEKYQSVVITSATRQSLAAQNERKWQALGLGVSTAQTVSNPILPDERISFSALPGVKTELAAIVREEQFPNEKGLLLGKRLIDTDFNAKDFGDSLTKETADGKRKYTIVHIASHFRLGDDAANSFLLLGGGNTLTMEQISNSPQMRFGNVELVTLSACNTAFGNGDSTGKEVDSLATFIELRGAKAILATLWAVADESTALLMSEFYLLKKENPDITKAEAMRQAQIAMIQGKLKPGGKQTACRSDAVSLDGSKQTNFKCDANAPFAHPYFWSPFILIGNWR